MQTAVPMRFAIGCSVIFKAIAHFSIVNFADLLPHL